jgi:hypothetical protein
MTILQTVAFAGAAIHRRFRAAVERVPGILNRTVDQCRTVARFRRWEAYGKLPAFGAAFGKLSAH